MICQLTQTIGISKSGLWILLIFGIYGLFELGNRLNKINQKNKDAEEDLNERGKKWGARLVMIERQ